MSQGLTPSTSLREQPGLPLTWILAVGQDSGLPSSHDALLFQVAPSPLTDRHPTRIRATCEGTDAFTAPSEQSASLLARLSGLGVLANPIYGVAGPPSSVLQADEQ